MVDPKIILAFRKSVAKAAAPVLNVSAWRVLGQQVTWHDGACKQGKCVMTILVSRLEADQVLFLSTYSTLAYEPNQAEPNANQRKPTQTHTERKPSANRTQIERTPTHTNS